MVPATDAAAGEARASLRFGGFCEVCANAERVKSSRTADNCGNDQRSFEQRMAKTSLRDSAPCGAGRSARRNSTVYCNPPPLLNVRQDAGLSGCVYLVFPALPRGFFSPAS